jgi:lysophospholipase L1-like esterase
MSRLPAALASGNTLVRAAMSVPITAEDLARRRRPARPFPWLPLVVLCVVVGLFAAMLAEISLRVGELRATNLVGLQCLGTSTSLQGQKGLYVLDSAAGYSMRPNTCVRLETSEYDGVLRTNGQGLVGPAVNATKPADEFRIIVLGDSYTVGGQVPYEQTFPAVLEQRLHAAGYPRVRVINAGVGGYTTFNEAGLLREHLAELQPDLVIVAAFLGNDVSENVLATAAGYRIAPEHPKGMTWGNRAAALVDASGGWFPRNGLPSSSPTLPPWDASQPLPRPVGNLDSGSPVSAAAALPVSPGETLRRSAHALWDGARVQSLLLGKLFGVPIDPSVSTAPGELPLAVQEKMLNLTSFEWTILRAPPRTYWLDVAWPLFGRYLADIRDTAASVGAPTVLLTIPEMAQFDEQMRARAMYEFRFAEDEVDWDLPQRQLAAQAAQVGLPELDLLAQFRSRADRAQLYLRLDTHFSALGHQATADALASFIQERGLT